MQFQPTPAVMALPTETNVFEASPAYIVYRDLQPGEPFDPTSPLLFFPAKGSDELFDALRIAFPYLKTHSERMRDAIIQFLLNERQEEQLQASPTLTMDTTAPTWPSMSSGSASVFSSPDLLDLPTPTSFANSPQAPAPQLARQTSTATSSHTSPPSLDQMTGVFSLSAEAQPKQRVRRKMTEAEKAEYRKRRIVKACDKCAKRKRKCPHNQAQMEVVPTYKSAAKAVKPVSHRSSKTGKHFTNVQEMALVEPVMAENIDFTTGLDMNSFQTFDDFPMFEDQFPEFTVDDLMYFDQPGANFQPQDYFVPNLSPSQQSRSSGSINHNRDQASPQIPNRFVPSGTISSQHSDVDANHELRSRAISTQSDTQHSSRRSGMRVSSEAETRNNLSLGVNHEQAGSLRQAGHQDGDCSRTDNERLREHLQTAQQGALQATHTAHLHKAGCGELLGLAEANSVLKEARLKPTLSQTTLRLVGMTRAVRTFAGLAKCCHSSPSRQQLVSMGSVVNALRQATKQELTVPDGTMKLQQSDQRMRPHSSPPGMADNVPRASSSRKATAVQREGHFVRTLANTGKPELRLQTPTSMCQSGGLRIGTATLPQARPQPELASVGMHAGTRLSLAPCLISGNAPLETQRIATPPQEDGVATHNSGTSSSAQPRRPPAVTLGEGVATLNSVSTELYMIRRRIPHKSGTNQNHQHTTNAIDYQDDQLSAQANGGAYQWLPPRDAHAAANGSGRSSAIALTPVSIVGPRATKDARAIDVAMACQSVSTYQGDLHGRTGTTPQQDRLRGHSKVPDRFGRSYGTGLAIILVLGAMLAAGILPVVVVCCAAWYSCFSFEKERLVQCTERNSSWLINILTRIMDSPAKTQCSRRMSDTSTSNEPWLKGSMYSLAYFPQRFITTG